eukprot:COSAG06_NODE_1228_length_10179_cov_3.735119_10_plen_62_part_00
MMLQSNVDSGVLPEMPPKITSRLEKDENYCSELLEQVMQRSFPPRFKLKNDHFAKTGSGQT